MKLPQSVIDRDAYYAEINKLLNDKDCYIIIDTNILASFYRLHEKARNELFAWLDPFVKLNRLKTPVWALNEYTKKFIRGQVGDYLSSKKKLDTISNDFEEAKKFLSLHIDVSNLPAGIYKDSAEYIDDLKAIAAKVKKLQTLVKTSGTPYINAINQQLKTQFDGTALESDIFALSEKVSISGPSRFLNQLPPGYEDKTKGFNPYGDLIIWEEIIGFARDKGAKKVILLTNDMKRDWMYIPQKIVIKGVERPNQEFKIVDPRLVFQFNLASGTDDFHIINLELLAHILIDGGNTGVYELAGALQIERVEEHKEAKKKAEEIKSEVVPDPESDAIIPEEKISEKESQVDDPPVPEENSKIETTVTVTDEPKILVTETEQMHAVKAHQPPGIESGSYSYYALADKEYLEYNDARIGAIIDKLRSHNWYVQNPAIEEMSGIFSSPQMNSVFSKNDLFVLGRNIYQAAAGGAYTAVQYLEENSLNSINNNNIQIHLMTGMVYEIFFNCQGYLRRPDYKSAFIDPVFALLKNPLYTPAVDFIQKTLQPFKDTLIALPSADPKPVNFEVSLLAETDENVDIQVVDGIYFNKEQLFIANNGSVRYVVKQYLHEKDIREELKRAFAIPGWQQIITFNTAVDKQILVARPNKILWRGPLPAAPEVKSISSDF
ncbi:PIN-like domain-containing protein [Mucilaginibacter sp. 10B2]|uniref:PIN-like domain-containing protein n=1 Tax=Mucilaginibacter sp. 10B2 TaxID=3048574 RepID=UPI002B230346|nr:PIN-like domain-containing protein [Mucilaginibacter sp. 10B2]MEB0280703.1 PIN domain-containing protein [Mucilaginibacter sp. 10B2]